jgi:hypothetical protein
MENQKREDTAPVDRLVICGSEEWLRKHALFACDYCAEGDAPTCHPAATLKMWDGKTICDDCWNNTSDEFLPNIWFDLDDFEPFKFLSK